MKSIIIDDEPFVREDLRNMLSAHRDIEIIGETETIDAAVELLSRTDPDVVFLDIQLRGGSGFDLVPFIHPSIDIIFFTAHDEYAVRAFEINALDFLLKPVTADRLAASLDRVRHRSETKGSPPVPMNPYQADDRIFIKTDEEQRFIAVNAVVAITSVGGNYTDLHLEDGTRPLVRRTLKEWEDLLPATQFSRIHRATIINLGRIERITNKKDGSRSVYLSGHERPFEVSRREAPGLKENLKVKNELK